MRTERRASPAPLQDLVAGRIAGIDLGTQVLAVLVDHALGTEDDDMLLQIVEFP